MLVKFGTWLGMMGAATQIVYRLMAVQVGFAHASAVPMAYLGWPRYGS